MKKIAVCEDNKLDREILKTMLQNYFENRREEVAVLEYSSGEEMLTAIEDNNISVDLIFLDIYMKELDGMETARKIRQFGGNMPIIFSSASAEFALQSYDVEAAGYLLKPLDKEKLGFILDRILKFCTGKRIAVKVRRQYRYLCTDEIVYVDSDKHTITFYLADGSKVTTTEKMGAVEKAIQETRFIRCHQSYLLNMDYVKDVQEDFILKDGTRIPIRVRGRKEMIDRYHEYFKKNLSNA